MKKIIAILALFLLGGMATANSQFTLMGPNHADFVELTVRRPGLEKSLYHLKTKAYRGPINLASAKVVREDYIKTGVKTSAFRMFYGQ